jgi:hypothetical protein
MQFSKNKKPTGNRAMLDRTFNLLAAELSGRSAASPATIVSVTER